MADSMRARLRACRILVAWQTVLITWGSVVGVVDLAIGLWPQALGDGVTLAVVAIVNRTITYPRYRRLKQEVRNARIAELEKELEIR